MKSKCTKCQEMRKASGLSYLKCPKCKQEARDERKKWDQVLTNVR